MEEAVNKNWAGAEIPYRDWIAASYHHQNLQKSLDPMLIVLRPNARNFYSIKLAAGDPSSSLWG